MKKIIIGIVIGIIISTTTVYAASILSSSVVYDNSTSNGSSKTVQGALDELYSKLKYGDATEEDILSGKTALVQGQEITGTKINNDTLNWSLSACTWSGQSSKKGTSTQIMLYLNGNLVAAPQIYWDSYGTWVNDVSSGTFEL